MPQTERRHAAAIFTARALLGWLGSIALVAGCRSYDELLLTATERASLACGDGHVDPFELCDVAIRAGERGACPALCADLHDPCVKSVLVGTSCRMQCLAVPAVASDGTPCCTDGRLNTGSCQPGSRDTGIVPTGGGGASAIDAARPPAVAPANPGASEPVLSTSEEDAGAARPKPIHRYTFDGTGTDVIDSTGTSDGTAVSARLKGDGQLALDPRAGSYVVLPGHLLAKLHSVTLETWIVWSGDGRRYERIFEFGNASAGDAGAQQVTSSFMLSPNYDSPAMPRVTFRARNGDPARITSTLRIPSKTRAHVAVVLNGDDRSMQLYVNARLAGSATLPAPLSMLDDTTAWLGRSLYPTDPTLDASFDEFRIYDVPLTAQELDTSYRNGPSTL